MLEARNSMLALVVFEYMGYLSKSDMEELERLHPYQPFLSYIRTYHDTHDARFNDGSEWDRRGDIPDLAATDLTFHLLLCDTFDMISRKPGYDSSVIHNWLRQWKQDTDNDLSAVGFQLVCQALGYAYTCGPSQEKASRQGYRA